MIHKCLYRLKYGSEKYEECCLKNEISDSRQIGKEFENVENVFLKKELQGVLQKAVNNLPFFYKIVFILREVEGYSVAEAASMLHISCINVRVRLNRVKGTLQKKLKRL